MYIIAYEIDDYPDCGGGRRFEVIDCLYPSDVQKRINELVEEYEEKICGIKVYAVTGELSVEKIKYATVYKVGV